ncbi:MAG: cobalt-precorrin-6A reductase [Spongiibacteraceae bacterium]
MTPRILLLGGTREALILARDLGPRHIYSLAGLGKVPHDLTCAVRVGGFGGAAGMAQFIAEQQIDLLLDATHPYAAQISTNAASAAKQTEIPYWALRRQGWIPQSGDDWREVGGWQELMHALADFQRPFFTLGREPLAHLDEIPASQLWTIRCLDTEPGILYEYNKTRVKIIGARGPFNIDAERALFAANHFDVLISKNSGSIATEPKLQVAREHHLPVLILKRPPLPAATREFDSIADMNVALRETGA